MSLKLKLKTDPTRYTSDQWTYSLNKSSEGKLGDVSNFVDKARRDNNNGPIATDHLERPSMTLHEVVNKFH